MWLLCDTVCGGGIGEGTMLLARLSAFSHFPCYPQANWEFLGSWVCVHSKTLWVSPRNSPVRLGVSTASTTTTGFYSQRFWGFISPSWNLGLCGLSHSPVVPLSFSACKFGAIWSSSHHPAMHPHCPGFPSPPLLLILMNVSSLTPWLLDFHTVQFSGSSGYFCV